MNSPTPNPASGGKSSPSSPPLHDSGNKQAPDSAAQPPEPDDARHPHHISRELAERGLPADSDPDDPASP